MFLCECVTTKWLASLSKNGRVVNVHVHMFIRSAIEFAATSICKQSFIRFWVTVCSCSELR